jgi:hypothetical protein
MRYAKESLVIQPERDVPLLRQIRNSKFVSHNQLFELMKVGGWESSRDSFNWRVRRLLKAKCFTTCDGMVGAGSAVYRISREGIALLEYHGEFTNVLHSKTEHLPHPSHVFHSLELNRIQLALANHNVLAGWQSEIEVASFNTISSSPYQKDYDAVVDVWIGDRKGRFALEYERSLKNCKQYDRIRAAIEAERQVGCILYLTSGIEMLLHILQEMRSVSRMLAFANATDFKEKLLETRVVTTRSLGGTSFRELLQ